MANGLFNSYIIEERSYASFIKREIHNLIRPHFAEQRTGEIDIVVSEMISNLIKHALPGELLYRMTVTENKENSFFEVICIDNGSGIKDLNHSIKDGVSSKSTLGHGIGSIIRLSNFTQIFTLPDWGTIFYSKFYNSLEYKCSQEERVLVRSINIAKPGEKVSGDGATVKSCANHTLVMSGDGLGHGEHAQEAIDTALKAFSESNTADPSEIIREIHVKVKRTRGLVATVAVLDHSAKQWQICGVGNIHTRLQRGLEYKNYICNNGIVGMNIPSRLDNLSAEAEKFQQLILCSDGIKTRWDLMHYPGVLKYDPMILAAAIYKDHSRKTDDMSILIVKVL